MVTEREMITIGDDDDITLPKLVHNISTVDVVDNKFKEGVNC